MDYEAQLKCRRAQCGGALTIPFQIVVKRDQAVIITRCFKCKTKYKALFPMLERDQWLPLIRDLFNRCENCGMVFPTEWKLFHVGSGISSFQMYRNVGLANTCLSCQKNGPKSIDEYIWSLIKPPPKSPPKIPVAPPMHSPLFCGIYCTYCGSAISPGASFCSNCGSIADKE